LVAGPEVRLYGDQGGPPMTLVSSVQSALVSKGIRAVAVAGDIDLAVGGERIPLGNLPSGTNVASDRLRAVLSNG